MKVNLSETSHANITFNTLAKVSLRGDQSYTIKWCCDDEFIGEMDLGGGTWGGFENKIGNWKIEFWQRDSGFLFHTYYHNLRENNILILPKFQSEVKGKIPNFTKYYKYISDIENKYGCNVYTFFINSEKFDLEFKTIKMNDNLDFSLIIEKEF